VKKLLITGGTGFIGRNLKEQLVDKYLIESPTHTQLDLLNEEEVSHYLRKHYFDVIIHTATWNATTTSTKDLSKVLNNNLRMFFNLARCSNEYGKMIYYGSGAEYDKRYCQSKVSEDYFDTFVPIDDYGFSKYIMSKYTEATDNIYNLCLFGVFGKYEDWKIRFISNACCKAIWDLPITIKQNTVFDYLYVDDLVKITEWFIENKPKCKSYNVCTGRVFDLLTLAEKVRAVCNKKLDVVITHAGLGKEYSGNNSKLLLEIGDYVFHKMDVCIQELYNWYLLNKQTIDREKLLFDK